MPALFVQPGDLEAQGSAISGLSRGVTEHGSAMSRACAGAEAGAGDPALASAAGNLADTIAVATQLAQLALASVGQSLSGAAQSYTGTDARIAGAAR
jgi:hypothetical protein